MGLCIKEDPCQQTYLAKQGLCQIQDSGNFGGHESIGNGIEAASFLVVDHPGVLCKSLQGHGEPCKSKLQEDHGVRIVL